MTAPVFVDTNVFVYALQASEPIKQPLAMQWLQRLWQEQLGRTSVQVLSECYVVFTRKIRPAMAPAEAWDELHDLLAWKPRATDVELLLRARDIEQRHRLSWWDSLVVAAAQLQNCALLLTEDLQDRAVYGGVTVRNPFLLGASEDLTGYHVPGVATASHPRRGRPRRSRSSLTKLVRDRDQHDARGVEREARDDE